MYCFANNLPDKWDGRKFYHREDEEKKLVTVSAATWRGYPGDLRLTLPDGTDGLANPIWFHENYVEVQA